MVWHLRRRDGTSIFRTRHRREETLVIRSAISRGGDRASLVCLGEETRAWREFRSRGGGRHGVLAHIESESSLRIDTQVGIDLGGLLRHRGVKVRVVLGRAHVTRRLNVERGHRLVLEHGEVNRTRDGSTALALVAVRRSHRRVHLVHSPRLLEHASVRLRSEVWLG